MATLFSRIIGGELPCHRVHEDDRHLAFLDIGPVQRGHVLVVPKDEVAYLFDMSAPAQAALWSFVAEVEAALRRATGCKRVVVMVVGYEVPHVHVHLIPTNQLEDFPLPPRIDTTPEALAATAAAIQNELGA